MSAAYPWNPQDEGDSGRYRQIDYLSKLQDLKNGTTTPIQSSSSADPIVRNAQQNQQRNWGPSHSSDDSGSNDASSGAAVQLRRTALPQEHSPKSSNTNDRQISAGGSGDTNPNQATRRGGEGRGDAEHEPCTTETLWERAEHFFSLSQLSSVFDEACNSRSNSPPFFEPRDLKSELANAAAANSDHDDEVTLGISRLCGPENRLLVAQHFPWFPQRQKSLQQQQRGDLHLDANDDEDGIVQQEQQQQTSVASQRYGNQNRAVVTSRTHEDIEVSPGHNVLVRLPPTNPVTTEATVRTTEEALSSENAYHRPAAAAAAAKQQPRQQRNNNNRIVANLEAFTRNDTNETSPKQLNAMAMTVASTAAGTMPIASLTVLPEQAAELERSISELTMRSSYAATDGALQKIPENRRMAYYAVGKHHRQSGRGGNRRCYFTGKLILGGAPFYAGSVLQGLRTLVVFCLPSAIGLPEKEKIMQHNQLNPRRTESQSTAGSLRGLRLLKAGTNGSGSKASLPSYLSHYTNNSHNLGASQASHATPPLHTDAAGNSTRPSGLLQSRNKGHKRMSSGGGASTAGYSHASKSMMSRLSSLDDLSLSIEGDLDPNWSLDRDFLLKVLPPANPELLHQMATLYPDQFETLPVQVRDASQWKLYVKFCFFSGLPISDGEMHYKIRDEIAEQVYGEEIVLSHDVMEASAGASAEILTLPNRTVMRYLRKHYAQQCCKLDDRVFQRSSWERVAPEV